MSPRLIAGNWKMHKTTTEAVAFVEELFQVLPLEPSVEIHLIPPYPAIQAVSHALQETPWKVGAQNLFWEPEGAFTGEVSAAMLKDVGCHSVIVGHSERRKIFGEQDRDINRKILAALGAGLSPILCVGESLEEREAGHTHQIVQRQITEGLQTVTDSDLSRIIIAYEPVWAIGTGRAASVEQASEVHRLIRTTILDRWTVNPQAIRILYGGSVNAENATALFQSDEINGALVGKACLHPESFAKIIASAAQ